MGNDVNVNGSYSVQEGDTLWQVSNQTGVSIEEIRTTNALADDQIQTGAQLTIPARPTQASDASDPRTTAGGIGAGQGSNPGLGSEANLRGYIQSLTRDSLRSGEAAGGVAGGSQWEQAAFLGAIGEKYRGKSLEQARQGGLDQSRTAALAGAATEGEQACINRAFDEAEQRVASNDQIGRIEAKVRDGSLLGTTHARTLANVETEKQKALAAITDTQERASVSAAYDTAVKTLDANNAAHQSTAGGTGGGGSGTGVVDGVQAAVGGVLSSLPGVSAVKDVVAGAVDVVTHPRQVISNLTGAIDVDARVAELKSEGDSVGWTLGGGATAKLRVADVGGEAGGDVAVTQEQGADGQAVYKVEVTGELAARAALDTGSASKMVELGVGAKRTVGSTTEFRYTSQEQAAQAVKALMKLSSPAARAASWLAGGDTQADLSVLRQGFQKTEVKFETELSAGAMADLGLGQVTVDGAGKTSVSVQIDKSGNASLVLDSNGELTGAAKIKAGGVLPDGAALAGTLDVKTTIPLVGKDTVPDTMEAVKQLIQQNLANAKTEIEGVVEGKGAVPASLTGAGGSKGAGGLARFKAEVATTDLLAATTSAFSGDLGDALARIGRSGSNKLEVSARAFVQSQFGVGNLSGLIDANGVTSVGPAELDGGLFSLSAKGGFAQRRIAPGTTSWNAQLRPQDVAAWLAARGIG